MENEDPFFPEFFEAEGPVREVELSEERLNSFLTQYTETTDSLVVISSGGMTAPLEKETVRFVDNFSTGKRGASLAENFLESGYWVIFLSRVSALQPFSQHLSGSEPSLQTSVMEQFKESGGSSSEAAITYTPKSNVFAEKVKSYHKHKHRFLTIPFTTVVQYLFTLRSVAKMIRQFAPLSAIVLCAAVADFYVPSGQLAAHKIQSHHTTSLHLELNATPKMLPMVRHMCPDALLVSFKLETDANILREKALQSLKKSHSDVVVANLKQTRYSEVKIYDSDKTESVLRTSELRPNLEDAIGTEIRLRHARNLDAVRKRRHTDVGDIP